MDGFPAIGHPLSCEDGLNLRYRDLFKAVGTNSMAKVGAGVLVDVLLEDLPVILVVTDFFAVHANRQERF
jgi:hypothetical protein